MTWLERNAARMLIALTLVALILALLTLNRCHAASTAKVAAKLATGQAAAAIASGQDATTTIGNRMEGDAATDRITRENDDAIHHAHGADAPVAAAAAAAGLTALCSRVAYRNSRRCKEMLW